MESALIVATGEKSINYLAQTLSEASIHQIVTVSSAGEARRLLSQHEYDLCVVNAPLSDEPGISLAQGVAEEGVSEVLLLVKAEFFEEICERVEEYGVITVSKPLNRMLFWNALKLAGAAHRRCRRVQRENEKLLQRIEDIRVVDRAKCILIARLSLTEEEAHKCIERRAMDHRISKRVVAEEIIATYER